VQGKRVFAILYQHVPDPFPIPSFRQSTEAHLKWGGIIDSDRKYMVQTLATILMTYNTRPTLKDCQVACTRNLVSSVMKALRYETIEPAQC